MRAFVIVLDSVGIGHAPDAASYGDEGAHTLGHIFEQVPGLKLPTLFALGLPELLGTDKSDGSHGTYRASYGRMREKDPTFRGTDHPREQAPLFVCIPAKLVISGCARRLPMSHQSWLPISSRRRGGVWESRS